MLETVHVTADQEKGQGGPRPGCDFQGLSSSSLPLASSRRPLNSTCIWGTGDVATAAAADWRRLLLRSLTAAFLAA